MSGNGSTPNIRHHSHLKARSLLFNCSYRGRNSSGYKSDLNMRTQFFNVLGKPANKNKAIKGAWTLRFSKQQLLQLFHDTEWSRILQQSHGRFKQTLSLSVTLIYNTVGKQPIPLL